jgi:hypothetical protein
MLTEWLHENPPFFVRNFLSNQVQKHFIQILKEPVVVSNFLFAIDSIHIQILLFLINVFPLGHFSEIHPKHLGKKVDFSLQKENHLSNCMREDIFIVISLYVPFQGIELQILVQVYFTSFIQRYEFSLHLVNQVRQ